MFQPLRFLVLVLCLGYYGSNGQAGIKAEDALQKVFNVLSGEEKSNCEAQCDSLLNIGAWEALAYLDLASSFSLSLEDLKEAVPDYYQFKEGQLYFKLINPKNHNEYGYSGHLQYILEAQSITVLNPKTKAVKDKWKVLYLDENYLALEMDDLRVFLSHVAPVH